MYGGDFALALILADINSAIELKFIEERQSDAKNLVIRIPGNPPYKYSIEKKDLLSLELKM